MTQMTEQEIVARELFRIQHPDIEWGHTGTMDDKSWRRFEQKCLGDAQRVIGILKEQAGYVQLDPGQNLPENPFASFPLDPHWGYSKGQQDMLKDNWKRIRSE